MSLAVRAFASTSSQTAPNTDICDIQVGCVVRQEQPGNVLSISGNTSFTIQMDDDSLKWILYLTESTEMRTLWYVTLPDYALNLLRRAGVKHQPQMRYFVYRRQKTNGHFSRTTLLFSRLMKFEIKNIYLLLI